LIYHFIALTAD